MNINVIIKKNKQKILNYIINSINHYHPKIYWKIQHKLSQSTTKGTLLNWLLLLYLKKTEAYHNAYTGTRIGCGPLFLTPPRCDHGLNGIVIAPEVKGGARILILHQVTLGYNIGGKKMGAPELGSNIMIGAGAKILGPIKIGNNVIIGSNSVITKNIPDNCTVVGNNRIITRKG